MNSELKQLVTTQLHSINSMIDIDDLDPATSLLSQGADSLDLIALFLALSKETGKEFPAEKLSGLVTLERIVEHLQVTI